jgi:hypothetical protein
MRTRPSFAETLDEAIGAAQDDTPPVADRFVYLPVSAAPFVFVYSRPSAAVTALDAPAAAAPAARARLAYRGPTASVRTSGATANSTVAPAFAAPGLSRAFTPRQQRAFDAMTALGARLRGDFEAADLRRAFRKLAHEYHPDRHPTSTPVELAHLSRTFADLSEHYRCLSALFNRKR